MSKVKSTALVSKKEKQDKLLSLIILFGVAFIVHVIFALAYEGYATDMNCFTWWASAVFENGVSKFYYLDAFTDYPPGYMYILWVVGAFMKLFNLVSVSECVLLVKMPAMLCDLFIGYTIYKIASKYTKNEYAILFSAAYMFNPTVILNSATWGQVDAVFTLFVVLMIYFITEEKLPLAYFMLAIGILIKPQTMIFTPVLIYGIVDQVFLKDFSWKRMFTQLGIGLSAIASMFILAAPFGLEKVIPQYVETLGQYEFASVNAYNLWALLGKNWASQDEIFLFLSYKTWGTIFIIATIVVSAYLCIFKNKEKESKYFLSGAFIIFSMFTLSVRMHERYVYPAMALILIAAAVKRNYKYVLAYVFLSAVQFLNAYHVLFYYDPSNYDFENPLITFVSLLSVAAFGYFLYVYFLQDKFKRAYTVEERAEAQANRIKNMKNNKGKGNASAGKNGGKNTIAKTKEEYEEEMKKRWFAIRPSEEAVKWIKWDFIIMGIITVLYACIAFYNLGDFTAPQTTWKSETKDTEIVFDFGETKSIDHFFSFLGVYENRKFLIQTSDNGTDYTTVDYKNGEDEDGVATIVSVFSWNKLDIPMNARYVKFVQQDDLAWINEMMFYDSQGNVLTPVNTSDYPEMFDEQDIFDGTYTFMNSTYFDEIYHGRTAYEMINGMYCYENTHPPLGKAFIAIGVLIFGMVPFGWRFMGTLFGVIMVPVMYMLGKRLTKKTWLATIITILLTFDFMHYTQTRIATIDVFVTLFVMLMYYFMLCYYKMSFYDTPLKKTFIPLLLSGICMGLGCASKWTGVYAGLGLGVIFFSVLFRRYMEYKYALKMPKGKTSGIDHDYVINNFSDLTVKTIGFCVAAFIAIPGLIYLLSYIPFSDGTDTGLFAQMLGNQNTMFSYHSALDATHPYSSTWNQWPIITRPLLYYLEDVAGGLKAGISAMGNPLVWWAGIPAFVYMIYLVIKERSRTAYFLAVGYMAQYLPWMMITRCTFIYHYFPSVPFVVMMVGYSIYRIYRSGREKAKPWIMGGAFVYAALVIGAFVLFYPVISGAPTTVEFVEKWLKWFNDWVLLF